jgi:hypothetical protein
MLNAASKYNDLRLHLKKLLNFKNQKKKIPQKLRGGYPPLESFDEGFIRPRRNPALKIAEIITLAETPHGLATGSPP